MGKWRIGLLALLAWMLAACAVGSGAEDEELGETGSFIVSADDEALDPSDPPVNPDPKDPIQRAACPERSKILGPTGLTFVIHISKFAERAERELEHLKKVQDYLRARDVFMVERTSPILDRLRALFPCNAMHFIAYPDEMDAALGTGGRIDGIAVDWEGGVVDHHDQAFTIEKLAGYARKIRAKGKQPGFVPVLPPAFDDGFITTRSGMDYELVQIQGRCVTSPAAFAAGARSKLLDFKAKNNPLRNMGVEISMDSFDVADNHVGPVRAADCTRAAYGKGARVIYLYGNGDDTLVPYFQRLHNLGVRHRGG
jgi:hypothetical protein